MAEYITQIALSSGTVVEIPICPMPTSDAPVPGPYHVDYMKGAVFAHRLKHSTIGVRTIMQTLSDDDFLEFLNIVNNWNCTSIEFESLSSANVGNYISIICWSFWGAVNGWCLNMPADRNGTTITVKTMGFGTNQNTNYWNSYNEYAQIGTHDYRDYNAALSDPDNTYNLKNCVTGYKLLLASKRDSSIAFAGRAIVKTTLERNIASWIEAHPNSNVQVFAYDPDSNTDPYIIDPSVFGGGNGDREDPDDIEKAEIPDLPELSAVDTGLVTLYTATNAQLQALGGYLWSSLWDIETNFKKLFSDPMNCLVGLSIVPVAPTAGGAQNVKFGNINTNIALNVLSSQFVELDCGSVNIKEYIGSFLDYSPYVNISLYLPYIGYRELSPDDVMNDTIHVVYHIDVLSGGCCAMIETGKKGLLYSFNGSCITNVPITAINYSGAIQNAVSAVGAGLTTVAGIATGAAPVAAVGAASMLSSAANTAMNSKPTIQRSGSMGGSAGLMSYQKPLLVITRPRMSVPDKLNKFVGLTTNVTMNLSQVKGFTQVEHVHLSGIAATQDEKDELMTLLRQGVIF